MWGADHKSGSPELFYHLCVSYARRRADMARPFTAEWKSGWADTGAVASLVFSSRPQPVPSSVPQGVVPSLRDFPWAPRPPFLALYMPALHFTEEIQAIQHASPQAPAPFATRIHCMPFPPVLKEKVPPSGSKSTPPPVLCIFYASQGSWSTNYLLFHVPSLFLSLQ